METRSFRVNAKRICEGDTITQIVKGRVIRNRIEGITPKHVVVESDLFGCTTVSKQDLIKRLSSAEFAVEVGI